MAETDRRKMPALLKIAVEWGPLIAFFIANAKGGIFLATAVFMAATILALLVAWLTTRRLAMVPLISAIFVGLFGALTLWLQDEVFIKVKVTLVNALFGSILLIGLYFGKQFLKTLLGETLNMDDAGWYKLTLRWGVFFFTLAGLNEILWRSLSTDAWVNFKVFGILPLTLLFALAQMPLMQRHLKTATNEER
ncbi:MAG: septation protein A [Pseudomonadota bacterium]|nr:septation protein A [Pseudomonadota bacterium]